MIGLELAKRFIEEETGTLYQPSADYLAAREAAAAEARHSAATNGGANGNGHANGHANGHSNGHAKRGEFKFDDVEEDIHLEIGELGGFY